MFILLVCPFHMRRWCRPVRPEKRRPGSSLSLQHVSMLKRLYSRRGFSCYIVVRMLQKEFNTFLSKPVEFSVQGVLGDANVLRIRDILVPTDPDADPELRIRILGSVPLTNGSGCGSVRAKNIRILRIRNIGTFTFFFKDKKS
jgi:hypothetical protein